MRTRPPRARTWSLDALTSNRPSSDGTASRTHSACPVKVLMQYLPSAAHAFSSHPVATSQTRIVLSRDADINCSPVGMKRTLETEWSCPCSVFVFLYSFAGSQSLMVRSDEHVAMRQQACTDFSAHPSHCPLDQSRHRRPPWCVP